MVCVCVQFAYDKQQEVNVSFHIKDTNTKRKIDSTLTGWCVIYADTHVSYKLRQSVKRSCRTQVSLVLISNLFLWTTLISSNLSPSPPFASPTVVLYNCSVGREDCSLCKHADAKYQCVWCAASHSCVYRELCASPQPAQCPNPEITDVSFCT